MARKIPNNTEFFEYTSINPKNKISCDCAQRAIAFAEQRTWEDVVLDMTEFGLKKGLLLCDKALYPKYLESRGWVKQPMVKHADGSKYTGAELCGYLRKHGIVTAIVNMGGYVTVIHEGKIRDTWNTSSRCTGNYWIVPNPFI